MWRDQNRDNRKSEDGCGESQIWNGMLKGDSLGLCGLRSTKNLVNGNKEVPDVKEV